MSQRMRQWRGLAVVGVCVWAGSSSGQSLFRGDGTASGAATKDDDRAAPLYSMSLIAVEPQEPRAFVAHDLVTILVQENSRMRREQTYEESKSYKNKVELIEWSQLREILKHLGGVNPATTLVADPLSDYQSEFEGDAEYERRERITAQVTAQVIEVKPNGTLLIEARTTVQTDEEVQVITLTGLCRTDDIDEDNSIQSNRMFNLTLNVQHEGQMRKTTKKGLIPRVLEAIFNF